MIHVKDHKQYDMFNPFEYLGPKRLALLESSWAHLFREEILHKLPGEQLFPLYSEHSRIYHPYPEEHLRVTT
jgi:hypothetical protein